MGPTPKPDFEPSDDAPDVDPEDLPEVPEEELDPPVNDPAPEGADA